MKLVLAGVALGLAMLVFFAYDTDARTRRPRLIEVTATLVHQTERQQGRPGHVSNPAEQSWRLHDRWGRPIGRMVLACRWVVRTARFCAGEIKMPLGTMTVAGASFTPIFGLFTVTGGTGFYFGVGGEMRFAATSSNREVLLITLT